MLYGNDFSHYTAENILQSPSSTSHSGPELCYEIPESVHADRLAREVVLDRVTIITIERPTWISGGGSVKGLKLNKD